jgi:hypothetical protein
MFAFLVLASGLELPATIGSHRSANRTEARPMQKRWAVVAALTVLSCYFGSLSLNIHSGFGPSPVMGLPFGALGEIRHEGWRFIAWSVGATEPGWSPLSLPWTLLKNGIVLMPHVLLVLGALLLPWGRPKAALLSCACGMASLASTLSCLTYFLSGDWKPGLGLCLWSFSAIILAVAGSRQAWRLVAPSPGTDRRELVVAKVA